MGLELKPSNKMMLTKKKEKELATNGYNVALFDCLLRLVTRGFKDLKFKTTYNEICHRGKSCPQPQAKLKSGKYIGFSFYPTDSVRCWIWDKGNVIDYIGLSFDPKPSVMADEIIKGMKHLINEYGK
jgi:hypothetical protein